MVFSLFSFCELNYTLSKYRRKIWKNVEYKHVESTLILIKRIVVMAIKY